jgi:hypothetical protein
VEKEANEVASDDNDRKERGREGQAERLGRQQVYMRPALLQLSMSAIIYIIKILKS